MFLLVSCSFAFQYLLCFVHSQGQRTKAIENKNIDKETGEFPNQSYFINYDEVTRGPYFKMADGKFKIQN